MRILTILIASLALTIAQQSLSFPSGVDNPLTNPGCSTAVSIVDSCGLKLQASATITAAVYSCICYDDSGNYIPSRYDDAASSCTDYQLNIYHTNGNSFLQYIAGFCTDPAYATATSAVASTTQAVSVGSSQATTTQAGTSSNSVANPGGPIKTSTSSSSLPASITTPPSSATASGSENSAGFGGTAVTSTSSKAEGANSGYSGGGITLWSLFWSIIGALLAF